MTYQLRNLRSHRPDWRPRTARSASVVLSLALAVAANVVAMAPAQAASMTFTVNSAADPGTGGCDATECTLREALNAANANPGADTINFSIGTGGPQTIQPVSDDLPPVTDQVTIDGTTQPGYVEPTPLIELNGQGQSSGLYLAANNNVIKGLAINRFLFQQILVAESSSNSITKNYLGTNREGTVVLGGGDYATLRIRGAGGTANNNQITSNVIAGGQTRVGIEASSGGNASDNTLFQNSIGVGAGGIALSSVNDGVTITSTTSGVVTGNTLQENQIANNGAQGIDLEPDGVTPNDPGDGDSGPNNLQNFPVLTQAVNSTGGTTVSGTLNSTPSSTFRVELFSSAACDPSGYGEGRTFVGSVPNVTTDSSGNAQFTSAPLPDAPTGSQVTATATNTTTGDTSEFSQCQPVTGPTSSAPGSPTGVTAAAGDAQAEVNWIAPDSNGGSALTSYTVESVPDTASTPVVVSASTTQTSITGLSNNTSYTFTVTAKNSDGLSSAPSAASDSVTPQQGAAPPETATANEPAGSSLSTGDASTTTAADPTNTSIVTPNGGVVSIAEGAMTNPPGDTQAYFGQQIDITAPDATANDPLMFTFFTDCSVLPAAVSSCTAGAASTSLAAPTTAAAAATAAVTVQDYAYSPKTATVGQGGQVTWSFQGPNAHTVTDKLGLGPSGAPMFDSGLNATGTTYTRGFPAAGRFSYRSTANGDPTTMTGTVRVPVQVSAATASAGDATTVRWATRKPAGYRFDVQYRYQSPGTAYGSWMQWRPNTTLLQDSFPLSNEGSYQFRSRLENRQTRNASLWALPTTVAVTPPGGGPSLDSVAMFHETATGNVAVPDCTGVDGVVQPTPACTWSEEILPDGNLKVVVYTTGNGRWRTGVISL